jgi:hypothetical protein
MALRGVRSSWLIVARNVALAWLASSAWCCAVLAVVSAWRSSTLDCSISRDNLRLFVLQLRRDEHEDGLADRFARLVAEHLGRTGVPAADHTVQSLADDGVVRRFDDRREPFGGAIVPVQEAPVDPYPLESLPFLSHSFGASSSLLRGVDKANTGPASSAVSAHPLTMRRFRATHGLRSHITAGRAALGPATREAVEVCELMESALATHRERASMNGAIAEIIRGAPSSTTPRRASSPLHARDRSSATGARARRFARRGGSLRRGPVPCAAPGLLGQRAG